MRKLDWDRLVPLGLDGKSVRNRLLMAWGAGVGWSLGFLIRYAGALDNLYLYDNGRRYLMEGVRIAPYADILDNSFLVLAAVAAAMVFVAAGFYFYHYHESRSIYTMKRLPDPWELWRRCLTLPACTAAVCGLSVLVLRYGYLGIYLQFTPSGCLP